MSERIEKFGLRIDPALFQLIEEQALPGTGITPERFWRGLSELLHGLGPRNRELLARRDALQSQIDQWHRARQGQAFDREAYQAFLRDIGYIVDEPADFQAQTEGVDPEIARIPGPQLVVPVMNARYALNAANARWGSLYDALYGTDALGDRPSGAPGYDPERGARVIAWAKAFLDQHVPLAGASHADVLGWRIDQGRLLARMPQGEVALADPSAFAGHRGDAAAPQAVLLRCLWLPVVQHWQRVQMQVLLLQVQYL